MNTLTCVLSGTLDFLYYIAPQVLAVILGGLIFQRYWVARTNESALIDHLAKELDELRNDCLQYWNLDLKTKENRPSGRILEQKIKGGIRNLNSDLRKYSERYCKKAKFDPLMVEVTDACTGGTFEGANRAPDPGR
ncbi:MAG TPA: hypothetical protein VJA21_05590 [Verrucomicrobiae bacterium]